MQPRFAALTIAAMLLLPTATQAEAQEIGSGAGDVPSPGTPAPGTPGSPQQQPDAIDRPASLQNVEGGFLVGQEPGQYLGSNILGAEVITADGETIGTVDDLLINEQGYVMGIIVGVGGFLGIGEWAVAMSVDMLEIEPTGGAHHSDPGTPARGWGWWGDEPIEFIRVDITREQLDTAPQFEALPR